MFLFLLLRFCCYWYIVGAFYLVIFPGPIASKSTKQRQRVSASARGRSLSQLLKYNVKMAKARDYLFQLKWTEQPHRGGEPKGAVSGGPRGPWLAT